ncbi:MAG: gliding motility-associated C-terminal domain-containing protein [Flavobacteriales bacterium]|nr:MAG: gliding motility-associated C-terminal domain-containing protein [Flavobacteriales bacterium]
MNARHFIALCFIAISNAWGQNLFLDPTFDSVQYSPGLFRPLGTCPPAKSIGYQYAWKYWASGTQGFYHECNRDTPNTHFPDIDPFFAPGNGVMPLPKRGRGYTGLVVFRNTASPHFPNLPGRSISQHPSFNGLDSGETYILEFFYRTHPVAGAHNRHISVYFSEDSSSSFFNTTKYLDILLDSFPPDDRWAHLKVSFTAQGNENHIYISNAEGNINYTAPVQNPMNINSLPPNPQLTHPNILIKAVWLIDDIHLYKASDTLFTVDIGKDTTLCMEDTLILTAPPVGFKLDDTITTWKWNTGHTSESIRVTQPGIYSVEVTINQTYKAYDTIVVDYEPFPIWRAPFGGELVLCKEESHSSKEVSGPELTHGGTYQWSTGSSHQTEYFYEQGKANLRVITPCYDQTKEFDIVERFCLDIEPYIPSAFTPFGQNPQWIIGGIESNTVVRVEVYNRWGQRVFHSEDYFNNWWDGTFNGKVVPSGVYSYRIVADYEGRDPVYKTGTVTIVR